MQLLKKFIKTDIEKDSTNPSGDIDSPTRRAHHGTPAHRLYTLMIRTKKKEETTRINEEAEYELLVQYMDRLYLDVETPEEVFKNEIRSLRRSYLGREEVTELQERMQIYLRAIRRRLKNHTRTTYDKIYEGVKNVESLEKEIGDSLGDIRETRNTLAHIREAYLGKSVDIVIKQRRKNNLNRALECLIDIRERLGGLHKKVDVKKTSCEDYAEVIVCVRESSQRVLDHTNTDGGVSPFSCLRNMEGHLKNSLEEIRVCVRRDFERSLIGFQEKKYCGLLRAYYHLEVVCKDAEPFTRLLERFLEKNVKNCIKKTLEGFHEEDLNDKYDEDLDEEEMRENREPKEENEWAKSASINSSNINSNNNNRRVSTANIAAFPSAFSSSNPPIADKPNGSDKNKTKSNNEKSTNGINDGKAGSNQYSGKEKKKAKKSARRVAKIAKGNFTEFLRELYNELGMVMFNYHLCWRFHENFSSSRDLIDNPPFCKSFAEYVRETKTEYVKCRKTLWGSIQRILSEILLHSHQIIELPLSEFFVFLDITNKLMEIGETFSDTTSNALRDAVHEMGIRYFRNFHLNKLAEMKGQFQNEIWYRIPVDTDYKVQSMVHLLEIFPENTDERLFYLLPDRQKQLFTSNNSRKVAGLSAFLSSKPFTSRRRSYSGGSDYSLWSKTHNTTFDKGTTTPIPDFPFSTPEVVVNTSSDKAVRTFEKYLFLMDILRYHSEEILKCLMKVVEYYVYTVFFIFTQETVRKSLINDISLPSAIKEDETWTPHIEAAHDSLILQSCSKNLLRKRSFYLAYIWKLNSFFESLDGSSASEGSPARAFPKGFLSISKSGHTFFPDISERITAVESLNFLHDNIAFIRFRICKILPEFAPSFLEEGLREIAEIIPSLRSFTIQSFMPLILRGDNPFAAIWALKWEIKEKENVVENASLYVDRIAKLMKEKRDRVVSLCTEGVIPSYLQETLIKELVTFCFKQVIESYAKIKRCTPIGRQLMATDFQSIIRQVDGIIRPLPMKDHVENYIHAWNLPSEDLANFVMKFKHYSFKCLWPLFSTGNHTASLKKANRKDFEKKIEKEYIDTIKSNALSLGAQ